MHIFKQTDHRLVSFAGFLWQRMSDNRVLQVAGSLTFTTLLALVPLLTIGLIVISAFPVFADYSTRFKLMLLSTLVPEFAGKIMTVYVRQFADNAEKLTAAGVLMLGATSLMLMGTIERTFNAIWGVVRARSWLHQGLIYWTVLTVGPVVLGGGLLLWHNLFKPSGLAHHQLSVLTELVQACGSVLLTASSLTLLYRTVPNRFVPWQHAACGSLVTAMLLEVARIGFGFYIDSIATYKLVYGAFSSIPIVLLWIYCLWLVVLVGAVFTCALSYWEGSAWRRKLSAHRRFIDALQLLIVLDHAHIEGIALSPPVLRNEICIGYDELGWILDRLDECGYVQKGVNEGWVLMKALTGISVEELFHLFVYQAGDRQLALVENEMAVLLAPAMNALAGVNVAEFAERIRQARLSGSPSL